MDLGLIVERMNAAETPEGAFDVFVEAIKKCGYDYATYSVCTMHPSLGLIWQHGLANSYPEDWMKYYEENNYIEIDPVVPLMILSSRPFFWDDLTADPDISPASFRLMREADDVGMRDGIGFSLAGNPGEIVGMGIARSERQESRDYDFLAEAHLLSVYLHETMQSLMQRTQSVSLTEREESVLSWATEGKTDREIGDYLSVSVNTVRFHWTNIFQKLGAQSRVYAVAKAIRFGLIAPVGVAPYRNR